MPDSSNVGTSGKSEKRFLLVTAMARSWPASIVPSAGGSTPNAIGTFWSSVMMLEHLGEPAAATRLMQAIERVTADPRFHTPDLGGEARTDEVTAAVVASIHGAND